MPRPRRELELVKLVGDSEAKGCENFSMTARNALKESIQELEKDVNTDETRRCLQDIHDAARTAGLDDVADMTVNAVGGSLPNDWQVKREGRLSLVTKPRAKDKKLIARIQELLDSTYMG